MCADLLLFLLDLFVGEAGEALLERDGERDERVAGVLLVDPCLDLRKPGTILDQICVEQR